MEISTNCAPAAPGAPTDAHEKIDGLDRAACTEACRRKKMRASNEKRRRAGGCTPARTALSYPLCHGASVQKFKLNLRTANSGEASMSRETPSWRPALTSAVNQHACVG